MDFTFRGRRYRLRSPDNHREGAASYEHVLRRRLAEDVPVYLSTDPRRTGEIPPTIQEFALEWFKTYAEPRLKPLTLQSYAHRYRNHLEPALGRLRIDAVNSVAIDRLVSSLVQRQLHPKTINSILGVLRRMLSSAMEWGRIKGIPPIRWLKAPPARFDFLSPPEADLLLRHALPGPWRLMLMTALHTGLRLGELVALRWAEVDLERGQLCVRRSAMRGVESSPKNNRIRFVPLTGELRAAFAAAARGSEYVFEQRGEPVTHSMAWRALQTTCKRAGIRGIGWHAMRHSFASHLVAENVPLLAVQMFLGHSDIKMTQRYAHIAPHMLRGYIEGVVMARNHAVERGNLLSTPGEHEANK